MLSWKSRIGEGPRVTWGDHISNPGVGSPNHSQEDCGGAWVHNNIWIWGGSPIGLIGHRDPCRDNWPCVAAVQSAHYTFVPIDRLLSALGKAEEPQPKIEMSLDNLQGVLEGHVNTTSMVICGSCSILSAVSFLLTFKPVWDKYNLFGRMNIQIYSAC